MKEIWKDIEGYEGLYQVSNLGNIRSVRINKNLTPIPNVNRMGYLQVGLSKDGKSKTKKIHRLVAEAFISNPERKPQVDHINRDPSDNRAVNLRWATPKENMNNPLTREYMKDTCYTEEFRDFHSRRMKEDNPMKNPEVAKKVADKLRGITLSEETRLKLSESLKGREFSEEHKQRISNYSKQRKRDSKGHFIKE